MSPVAVMGPATASLALGAEVPIPTFPLDVMRSCSVPPVEQARVELVGVQNPVLVRPSNVRDGEPTEPEPATTVAALAHCEASTEATEMAEGRRAEFNVPDAIDAAFKLLNDAPSPENVVPMMVVPLTVEPLMVVPLMVVPLKVEPLMVVPLTVVPLNDATLMVSGRRADARVPKVMAFALSPLNDDPFPLT